MDIALAGIFIVSAAAGWRIRTVGRSAVYAWIEQWAARRKRAWSAYERVMEGE